MKINGIAWRVSKLPKILGLLPKKTLPDHITSNSRVVCGDFFGDQTLDTIRE